MIKVESAQQVADIFSRARDRMARSNPAPSFYVWMSEELIEHMRANPCAFLDEPSQPVVKRQSAGPRDRWGVIK